MVRLTSGNDDLSDKPNYISGRGGPGVTEEFHERNNHAGRHLRELDGTDMNRLNEKLTILGGLGTTTNKSYISAMENK